MVTDKDIIQKNIIMAIMANTIFITILVIFLRMITAKLLTNHTLIMLKLKMSKIFLIGI